MNDHFDLEREINFVVREMCSAIRSDRKRKMVAEEIKAHFEDSIYEKAIRGISFEKAFHMTHEEFCNCNNSNIKQLLAITHNSISPQTVKRILYYAVRIGVAVFLYWILHWAIVSNGGHFYWYYCIPFAIIAVGLLPFKYFKEILSRTVFYKKLKKQCKMHSLELIRMNGYKFLFLKSANVCDFIIKDKEKSYFVKFFGSPMIKGSVCFLDEVFYTVSRVCSNQATLVDQRPFGGNLIKTPDLSYTTSAIHTYSFYVPTEDRFQDQIEKILLISPLPKEISFVRGNSIESTGRGEKVMDFYIHSKKSFFKTIV